MITDPLYPSQVFFMTPDSSNSPRHVLLAGLVVIMLILGRFLCVFVRLLT